MERLDFDPMDFIRLADDLVTADADEATLRTGVGRLYYAVFLIARTKTGLTGRRLIHERVRTAISPHDDSLARQPGSLGHLRSVADYEIQPTSVQDRDWHRNWDIARRNARSILRKLELLPKLAVSDSEDQTRGHQ
jgi:hypothetical protein